MKLLVMIPPHQTPAPEFLESIRLLGLSYARHGSHVPLPVLETAYRITHILYTTGNSFLTWDVRSINAAYSFCDSPRCLVSADKDTTGPDLRTTQQRTHRRIYRLENCSAFMGEIRYLYTHMDRFREAGMTPYDFREGVKKDTQCEVFQNMDSDGSKDLIWDSREGFFYNRVTQSHPCVLNFTEQTPGISRLFKRWKHARRKQMIRKTQALGRELYP